MCINKLARKDLFSSPLHQTRGREIIKWAKRPEWTIISTMLKDMGHNISWQATKYIRVNCQSMAHMSRLSYMDILKKLRKFFPKICLDNLKKYFIVEHNRKAKLKNRRSRNLRRWTHSVNWLRMSDFVTYFSTWTPFQCPWTSSRTLPSSLRQWPTQLMVRPSKALAILNTTRN